jgi:hypothetical protein
VSTFVSLGSRGAQQGIPDNTQRNPGNWTVIFDPVVLNCNIPFYEVSHITITGAPGSSFSIYVDLSKWEDVQNGTQNSWDPIVPIPLHPGQYLYFFWSDVDTDGNPPMVTIWLRYDADISANDNSMLGQGSY